MTARNVTSRARSSRGSRRATSSQPENLKPTEPSGARQRLQDAIEDERERLMTAETVLHCVLIAMNEDDGDNTHGPHYATLIALARELIKQSIDQLDSVRLKPMLETVGTHERYDVKEVAVEYVLH